MPWAFSLQEIYTAGGKGTALPYSKQGADIHIGRAGGREIIRAKKAMIEDRLIEVISAANKVKGDGQAMDNKIARAILAVHIEAKDYISIQTRYESEPSQCIPLSAGGTHLLGLNFRDFLPDGYRIIPLEQITSITHSEADAFLGSIVKREGISSFLNDAPRMNLAGWPDIFQFLLETKEFVIVETGEDECLDVGEVMAATSNGIEMRCFDAAGIWDEEKTFILYKDLSGVEIRSHYIKMFTKYLKDKGMVDESIIE